MESLDLLGVIEDLADLELRFDDLAQLAAGLHNEPTIFVRVARRPGLQKVQDLLSPVVSLSKDLGGVELLLHEAASLVHGNRGGDILPSH